MGGGVGVVIIIQGVAHRYGIDLSPDEAAAYSGAASAVLYFGEQVCEIIGMAILTKLSKWAGIPVPTTLVPSLTPSAPPPAGN